MNRFSLALLILVILNFASLISIIFIERKKPESAMGWILAVLFIPYLGFILYFLVGETFRYNVKRKDYNKILNDKKYKEDIAKQITYFMDNKNLTNEYPFLDLVILNANNGGSLVSNNNKTFLFSNAKDKYDTLFTDIRNAKSSIHLSYFILRKDEVGKELIKLLIQKANEGVEIRLLYDRIGSRTTPRRFFGPLKKCGGNILEYFPLRIWLRPLINHRNHRKIFIIDGTIGYIGGINLGVEYLSKHKRIKPWRDTHLKLVGSSVNMLQIQFFLDYLFVSKEIINFKDEKIFKKYFPDIKSDGDKMVQIIASGPDYKEENIRNAYVKMIFEAQNSLLIQTPYFIPDETILSSLKIASKSGVKIKLILPGVYDKKTVYYASLSYIQELLEDGIEVYLYKGFIHSKVIICDENIVSIGSANIDRRSFNLNFEINSLVYDNAFAKENIEVFNNDLNNSTKIDLEEYYKRPLRQKIFEQIFRLLAPIL